jgi:16S rRNA (adenine(1408)-N(1))-methyltransferase
VLHGLAGSMTVNFPWASLLRGVLGHDDVVLAAAYARVGLYLEAARPATAAEVAASGSSWARRLRAGRERPVTLLRSTRAAAGVGIMAADDICRRVQS